MSDHTHLLRKRIAQLEAKVQALEQKAQAQRQEIVQRYGNEFLALLDGDPNTKVTVTDIIQKLVFQDEEGNTISETNGLLVGKVIKMRFRSIH